MKHEVARNYLKTHRLKSGLSQREIGKLLGYKDPGQISRHERSASVPPLTAALAYELIFRVPVSEIFAGMRDVIRHDVEERLQGLETALGDRGGGDRDASLIAHKLVWLNGRKNASKR